MNLLSKGILPATLALILAPAAWAGDDDKKSEGKKGEEMTIRGVVSEVTVLGETDIDYATRKVVTAEATYLTIIGHPAHHEAMQKQDAQATADRNRDREVKRTSTDSSMRPRHRMNVYVLAVSPKTKVCECEEMAKEGSASKEMACDLDKLEIGDRVEITYNPKMMSKSSDDKDKDDAKPATMKHGRHRTYFGTAASVKIMTEPMEGDHSESKEKSEKK